jgi:hypothetical protein
MNNEELAKRVIAAVDGLAPKLAELEADIRALWAEFEKLPKGQTIAGCRTKTEFCRRHLNRTPRAIQYLLSGRREQSSREFAAVNGDEENPTTRQQMIDFLWNLQGHANSLPPDVIENADGLLKTLLNGRGFDLTGQTFDDSNLLVHEKFEQSPRDRSWVWLVENKKTGKAELWRSCDLTRIERRGQRHNKKSYACFSAFPGNPEWQEWMQRAQERLEEIKNGNPKGTQLFAVPELVQGLIQ